LPQSLVFHLKDTKKIKKVTLLGVKGKIKWHAGEDKVEVTVPQDLQANNGLTQAATFKIEYK
jgi:alpha-L-fucosidase